MEFEPVIGLEVHAELQTQSKMFCSCAVVDSTLAAPNTVVCPVCSGMPGTLPVVNQTAVEYALRVALALECEVQRTSVFARKNYFYPDLPKGYQISQYESPLAVNGRLILRVADAEQVIRIRRVHLEEDTGKLTHVNGNGTAHSLVDLNRAGVPLLEIVSEPDLHSAEAARAYGEALRAILRYLRVNSGDMEKGVIRFEANVSVRPARPGGDAAPLGTRTEVKNLNSFRAMERAILYEIDRQSRILASGGVVEQETLGWSDARGQTYSQRSKEEAHDYRYFPEPDLPPLEVESAWVERVRAALPELPYAKYRRFMREYSLNSYNAWRLTEEQSVADYFEQAARSAPPQPVANMILGDLYSLINQSAVDPNSAGGFSRLKITPDSLAALVRIVAEGQINLSSAKEVLGEMFRTGAQPAGIIEARGLKQDSDQGRIAALVASTLEENPREVQSFRAGKTTVSNFLFGQVMKKAGGKANPQVVRAELERQLSQ